jgi:hypothetical protein
MIKEAFTRALAPISLMVLFLIVCLSPLYLIAGLMTRSFSTTTPQTERHPVKR